MQSRVGPTLTNGDSIAVLYGDSITWSRFVQILYFQSHNMVITAFTLHIPTQSPDEGVDTH